MSERYVSINPSRIPVLSSKSAHDNNQGIAPHITTPNISLTYRPNGKRSRIPVLKSRLALNASRSQLEVTSTQSDHKSDDSPVVRLRSVAGRSNAPKRWTQSEPIDCLKYILRIVRSNCSPDNKFRAIKRFRDKRLEIANQMENYNDERVSQWLDSGYISSTNAMPISDEVFATNRHDLMPSARNPMAPPKDLNCRRRSYNKMRTMELIAMSNKYNSFNSEVSMSSISSIESLLDSRREDPEELLLALGFGYQPESQTHNRIPQRFFESPSVAKGVNSESVRKTMGLKDTPSMPSPSFPSPDFRERSYSCGPVNERFQKRLSRDSLYKSDLPEIITSSCSPLLQSPQTESILNPANRKFLDNQGKQDQQNQLSSRRLIIGTKSYKLDIDGDPLAFPKTPSPVATTPASTDNEMEVSSQANDEQIVFSNFNDNSKQSQHLFKRNLQRQKCVSDDVSSDLSSSTATLVDTVKSGFTDSGEHSGNPEVNKAYETDGSQISQSGGPRGEAKASQVVEAALVVAIQSLRLSLEFYRHQSLKMAKLSQKHSQSSHLSEQELVYISKIDELRESIHNETVEMDRLLSRHLETVHSSNALDMSFISQANVFSETIKKVKQLLREQQHFYCQMDSQSVDNDNSDL